MRLITLLNTSPLHKPGCDGHMRKAGMTLSSTSPHKPTEHLQQWVQSFAHSSLGNWGKVRLRVAYQNSATAQHGCAHRSIYQPCTPRSYEWMQSDSLSHSELEQELLVSSFWLPVPPHLDSHRAEDWSHMCWNDFPRGSKWERPQLPERT